LPVAVGDKAKTLLANNLNAPDSFQAHAGGELSDYIANSQVEDITAVFKAAGLDNAFPKELLSQITVAGKVYSVPADIHRANMVWVNPVVLKKAKLDPAKAPATVKDWIADLAKLKAAGVSNPSGPVQGLRRGDAPRDHAAWRPRCRQVQRLVRRLDQVGRGRRDDCHQ